MNINWEQRGEECIRERLSGVQGLSDHETGPHTSALYQVYQESFQRPVALSLIRLCGRATAAACSLFVAEDKT